MNFEDPSLNPAINIVNDKIVLTTEQQNLIIETWNNRVVNPPSIEELTEIIFQRKYDARSRPALAIRKFIKDASLIVKEPEVKKEIVLSDAHKEFIVNNVDMGAVALSRSIFNDQSLTALNRETKLVIDYLKSIDPKIINKSEYTPPKQHTNAAARINKYVYEGTIKQDQWKNNSQIRTYLDSLIKFCHHPRFVLIASRYPEGEMRNLFEGSYISYVWDKVDLTPEELDLYIDICQDIVGEYMINDEIGRYTEMLEQTATDAEGKKISLSIGEHIKNLRDDVSKNKERRKKAIENLQGKRSERIENKRKDNDTLIHLVDFVKTKEGRDRMAKTIEAKQKGLIDEVKRLESIDELVFEIYGVGAEEVIYSKV